jgi:hypothetical protein
MHLGVAASSCSPSTRPRRRRLPISSRGRTLTGKAGFVTAAAGASPAECVGRWPGGRERSRGIEDEGKLLGGRFDEGFDALVEDGTF